MHVDVRVEAGDGVHVLMPVVPDDNTKAGGEALGVAVCAEL